MKCTFCEKSICNHAKNHVLGNIWRCVDCGEIGINGPASSLCLPTYDGMFIPTSDTFSSVCRECFDKKTKEALSIDWSVG